MRALEKKLAGMPRVTGGAEPGLSRRASDLVRKAEDEAKALKDDFVSVEHYVLAMGRHDREIQGFFEAAGGVTYDKLMKALATVRGSQRVVDKDPEGKFQALDKYTRDLTEVARKGKSDPVIGRDEEIRRVMQVLSRRTKNNPSPHRGAGRRQGPPSSKRKSSLRIVRGDKCPSRSRNKRVALSLDLSAHRRRLRSIAVSSRTASKRS